MKRRNFLVISLLIAISLPCSMVLTTAVPAGAQAPAEDAWEWPDSIQRLGTGDVGTTYYETAIAWTPVMEREAGLKWRVLCESSRPTLFRSLKAGKIEAVVLSTEHIATCMEASEGYATRTGGPFPARVLWNGHVISAGFAVRKDSDIHSFDDIKPGHKFSLFAGSPNWSRFYEGLRNLTGLTKDELQAVPAGSYPASVKALDTVRADIIWTSPQSPLAYQLASGNHGVRFLAFPEDRGKQLKFLECLPAEILGKVDFGLESARGLLLGIVYWPPYVHEDFDEDLAYHTAKWMHLNYDSYKDNYTECQRMNLDWFMKLKSNTFIPIHDGTIRYLKEIGKWDESDDMRQKYNIKLLDKYIERYEAAIAAADKNDIKVDPANQKWVDFWDDYKKDLPRMMSLTDEEVKAALAKGF